MTDCLTDSALPEVSEGREKIGPSYTISRPEDERLKAMAERRTEQAPAIHAERGGKVQVFGEFACAAETWSHHRLVILKAEVMSQGEKPRFAVTYRRGLDPEQLYRCSCQRGDPENRIDEPKIVLKALWHHSRRFILPLTYVW